MSKRTEGYVAKVFTKSGNSARGKWVADSFKIKDADGNEDPFFYQMGFRDKGKLEVAPPFKEGDYIAFAYEDKDDSARSFVKGSGKVKSGVAPAPATAPAGGSSGGSHGTQQNIHYQNSRTAAIEVVSLLLEHKALPITNANSKAGVAARYDEIVDAVNKLTVQLFNDLETFRLLETVADAGVIDTSADGDLPDDEDEDELEDDIPFGDDDEDEDVGF